MLVLRPVVLPPQNMVPEAYQRSIKDTWEIKTVFIIIQSSVCLFTVLTFTLEAQN